MFFSLAFVVVVLGAVAQCEHYGHHSIELPRHSNHHISHYPAHSSGYSHPTHVDVPPGTAPIHLHMQTKSSPLKVSQSHHGAGGSYHESYSEDKPHYLKHSVTKPVYQEVNEVVTPHRKITQVVKPVHEQIDTHVAKHSGYGHDDYGHKEHHGYGHKEHHEYEHEHY